MVSLENLMTFPWIAEAVAADRLQLIGLWTDIAAGSLECWSPDTKSFEPV